MNKFTLALLSMTAVLAMSCEDRLDSGINSNGNGSSDSRQIGINVFLTDPSTKAGANLLHSEIVSIDGTDLDFQVVETSLSNSLSMEYSTKGAPIKDSIFKANKEFLLFMYENSTTAANDTLVDSSFVAYNKASDKWKAKDTINFFWPDNCQGLSRDFWASQQFDSISTIKRNGSGSSHTLSFNYKIGSDSAWRTKDFVMAYTKADVGTNPTDTAPSIDLRFIHPLTGIQFAIGDLGIDYGLTVTKIELKSMKYKGSCVFDPSKDKDSLQFIWTLDDEKADYVQDYKMVIADYKRDKNFDLDTVTWTKTFFVMPQIIEDGAQLVVTFTRTDGKVTQLVKQLNKLGTGKFQPGSLYTYKISGGGVMGLEVYFDPTNKDYLLKDTGNVRSYMRAEIIANWYKDTAIVAPWNGQADFDATLKTIESVGENDSTWVKGPDGFYYYTQPVDAYTATKVLIKPSSFKGTSSSAVLNQQFRISVAGQMVRWSPNKDYVTRFWGLTKDEADAIFKH